MVITNFLYPFLTSSVINQLKLLQQIECVSKVKR